MTLHETNPFQFEVTCDATGCYAFVHAATQQQALNSAAINGFVFLPNFTHLCPDCRRRAEAAEQAKATAAQQHVKAAADTVQAPPIFVGMDPGFPDAAQVFVDAATGVQLTPDEVRAMLSNLAPDQADLEEKRKAARAALVEMDLALARLGVS